MKHFIYTISLILLLSNFTNAQAIDRKIISQCKVTFDVTVVDSTVAGDVVKLVSKAVRTSYVKNGMSRNDLEFPGYKHTSIFKAGSDTIVVLKELGNKKYINYIDKRTLRNDTNSYDGIRFVTTRDSKKILGYECKKAQAQLPDGSYFFVYYAPAIEPSNKDFEQQFKELPGFVLEYESYLEDQKTRVKFTATAIDFSKVPAALFDWPKSGYRVL